MHKEFAQLLAARIRWVRPGSHRISDALSRQADNTIFGEEGPAVMLNAQDHPPSMDVHLSDLGAENPSSPPLRIVEGGQGAELVDQALTRCVGDPAP